MPRKGTSLPRHQCPGCGCRWPVFRWLCLAGFDRLL